MKVAFLIPFAFERFFHDAKQLFPSSENFENDIISKRNTWHFNWCNAMRSAGIEVVLFHISLYGKKVREYTHVTGIPIVSVPTSFRCPIHKNEISFSLLKEIDRYKPDIIFSVTHILDGIIDMYDIITFYFKNKGHKIVSRNPGADSYDFIFNQKKNIENKIRNLPKSISIKSLFSRSLMYVKWLFINFTSNIKFYIKKRSLNLSDLIIPQTQIDFNGLIKNFKVTCGKLRLLPKPVDTVAFHEVPKSVAAERLGMDPENKYIIHVSNLYDTKGCEHIIEIMPELLNKYTKIILLIVGGGNKKHDLESMVEKMNLKQNIILLGQVENEMLVLLYNIADAFVLPTDRSIGEGIPNVILESIACNTPTISTNIAGPSEILSDGLGLLVEMKNKTDLLKKITMVLDGEFEISETKRMKFLKDYSLDNVGNVLYKIFMKIISAQDNSKLVNCL